MTQPPQSSSTPDAPLADDASPRASAKPRGALRRVHRLRALRGLRARDVGASGRVAVGPARRGLNRGKGPLGLWILSPLVMLALIYIVASRWVAQAVDVEGLARREIIPQLERQLGKRIEVGRIESDFSGLTPRVTLHQIVIGRDARSPLGALFQARWATLSLDAWGLISHRSTAIGSIRELHLEAPQLDVQRGQDGRWNLLELVKHRPKTTGERPVFTWSIANGRVFLTDRTRVRGGKYLQADARALNAQGRVNGARPLDFQSTSQLVLLPSTSPSGLQASGEVDALARWGIADVDVSGLPLSTLALWGLEPAQARDITLRSGTAHLQARIGYDPSQGAGRTLLAQGQARLQDVDLSLRPAQYKGQEVRVESGAAALAFSSNALEVRSASARILNTPLNLNGALSWPTSTSGAQMLRGVAMDVSAQSGSWDIERLRAFLPPAVRQQLDLNAVKTGALWNGSLRVRGGPDNARLTGLFGLPSGSAASKSWSASWQPARTSFDVRVRSRGNVVRSLRGRVELSTPSLQARLAPSGTPAGAPNRADEARVEGARTQVQFAWRDVSPGASSGPWQLSATGTVAGQAARGQSAGNSFQAASTQAAWNVAASGAGSNFDLSRLIWSGSLQAQGQAARASLASSSARAQGRAGAWAVRLEAPSHGGSQALSPARVALWARDWAATSGTSSAQGSSLRGEIKAQPNSAPQVRLGVRGSQVSNASWGQASLRALNLQLDSPGGSGRNQSNGNGLQQIVSELSNWSRQRWRGALSWQELSGAQVQWKRVAPALAALQSSGRVDGAISFPALDGPALRRALDQMSAQAGRSQAASPQVLARALAQAAPGARGELQVRDAIVSGVPLSRAGASWTLGAGTGAAGDGIGTFRFASSLDARTLAQVLDSPELRSRLGRDVGLLEVARGVAGSNASAPLSLRGAVDVARLASGDWRHAGSFEASTPRLALDAARLNPWLASARGRELSRAMSRGAATIQSVSGLAQTRFSVRSRPGALDAVGVAWELSLPQARVQAALSPDALASAPGASSTGKPVPAQVEVAQVLVRGGGTLRLSHPLAEASPTIASGLGTVRFEGVVGASAGRAALFTPVNTGASPSVLSSLNGARLQNVRATAQLGFAVDTSRGSGSGSAPLASAPSWKAQLEVGGASLPLPATLRSVAARGRAPASSLEVGQVRLALSSAGSAAGGEAVAIVPRISARLAGGRADGSLRFNRDGSLSAQLLASDLDASALARTVGLMGVSASPASTWGLSGRAWSSLKIEGKWPRFVVSTQSRYLNGSVQVPAAGAWPVDLARLSVSVPVDASRIEWARLNPNDARTWRGLGDLQISEATLWSHGARAAFTGAIRRAQFPALAIASPISWSQAWAVQGQATLNELPLREARRVPALSQLWRDADVEGALSASLNLSGALAQLQVKGPLSLKLASALGLRGDAIEAPLEAVLDLQEPRASRLQVTGLRGMIENAPFGGSLALDGARNTWSLRAQTRDLPSARLLQGASRLPASTYSTGAAAGASRTNAVLSQLRSAPVRGRISADVALAGTLFNARGELSPRPRSGTASIETGELRWRARNVGSLTADIALDKRVLQIAGIQLFRSESRARDLARDIVNSITNPTAPATTPDAASEAVASQEVPASSASLLRLTGEIPLDAQSKGLELRLVSEDTALPVVISGADELLRFLQGGDQKNNPAVSTTGGLLDASTTASIAKARQSLASLPRGVRGRVALEAHVAGSLAAPEVSVERLVLRDAAFTTPEGEQILPTIDTAFSYNGAERAIIVQKAQVLLAANALASAPRAGAVVSQIVDGPLAPTSAVDEGKAAEQKTGEQTVLELDQGGRVELDGIVNLSGQLRGADVALLSRYVPALRTLQEQSGVKGRIEEMRFKAQGALDSPTVSGSLLARGLALRDNTLDRLEVKAFRIGDGAFTIGAGDLLLQKGAFLSRSASVDIPWTWGGDGQSIGPRREAAIRVSLPVATNEFGALAGVLMPSLQRADAQEFKGLVELGGTIEEPKLSGDVLIRGGRFRVAPRALPFDVGLENVSGHLSFSGGNHLIIDDANPLQGRIVTADRISAPKTGNPLNPNRSRPQPAPTQGSARAIETSDLSSTGSASPTASPVEQKTSRPEKAPELSGGFSLGGGVVFDLSPEVLAQPIQTLGSHHYDLSFALNRAQAGTALGGLHDISLGLRWKTQGAQAAQGQVVRWMAVAQGAGTQSSRTSFLDRLRGRKISTSTGGGGLLSFGALRLRPDFPSGLESMARSQALPLSEAGAMQELPVQAQVRDYLRASNSAQSLEQLITQPPQIRFDKLRLLQRGLGSGTINGALTLDNTVAQPQPQPRTPQRRAQSQSLKYLQPASFGANANPWLSGLHFPQSEVLWPAPRLASSRVRAAAPQPSLSTGPELIGLERGDGLQQQVLAVDAPSNFSSEPLLSAPQIVSSAGGEEQSGLLKLIQFNEAEAARALRVSGTVTVEDTVISGVPPTSDGVSSAVEWPGAPVLDVRAVLGRNVRVVSPNLRTQVSGSLSITGTPREPFARGTFQTSSGSVRFPGANARILDGRIDVTVGRDPVTRLLRPVITLDVSARGQVGSDTITISLRGPLDLSQNPRSAVTALGGQSAPNASALRVDITSSRGMSQDEAFARLLGTSGQSDTGEALSTADTNRAYAQAVVSLVSAPLFSGLERSLEDILGLSSLTLEYRFNEPSSIQIGKAIGSRIYVTYRRTIGGSRFVANSGVGLAPRGDSLRVEYRLKGDVQVVYQISRDQLGTFSDTVGGQSAGQTRRQLTIEKTWRF